MNHRQVALRRLQNNVKFFVKRYKVYPLRWFVSPTARPGDDNATSFIVDLKMSEFVKENLQFKKNLQEYHYVKFNYFAVKCGELLYLGYQNPELYGVKPSQNYVAEGVTAMQAGNYPFYLCWDIEESFNFGNRPGFVDINAITQYPLTKSIRPSSKKPISFVYKVPTPWRQYFDTTAIGAVQLTQDIYGFFSDLSGIKNIRSPTKIVGGHVNWWQGTLPHDDPTTTDPDNFVFAYSTVAITYYIGCTFRGRKIMSVDGF